MFDQFCQFRSLIRGSKEHLIVSIDIVKDKLHAFFGTAYGKTLWCRLIFTNDFIGYLRLVEQTELLLKQHRLKETIFGLEPTGNYHKPLAHWLIQHPGFDSHSHTKTVKRQHISQIQTE
jgi:transposase